MSRIHTMSRFAEPSARDEIATCAMCGDEHHYERMYDDQDRCEYRCAECQELYLEENENSKANGWKDNLTTSNH